MKNKLLTTAKILVLALAATTFITTQSRAQRGDAAFNKGDKTIGVSLGAGVSYGYTTYGSGRYSSLPAIAVTYDQCFFEDIGPGNIGIGGIIGFKSSTYRYDYYNSNVKYKYKDTYTNYIIGFRGTYHLTLLKDKNNKFDPYAGVTLGLRLFTHTYDNPNFNSSYYNYNSAYPVAGAFVGAKYNFATHVGAFAEVGYDISFARIGLNFNF